MTQPRNAIYKWLQIATTEERHLLAKAAKTSSAHLRHIATGRRNVEAQLAQRLAAASKSFKDLALHLDQRDLCKVCSVCPLVKSKAARTK